jgi:hypothetical protein
MPYVNLNLSMKMEGGNIFGLRMEGREQIKEEKERRRVGGGGGG